MKNRIFLSLACTLVMFSADAQQTDTAAFKLKFGSYLENSFQEKIYIHHDKDTYLAGEIIWMKVYNTEAYTNRPSAVSKVAYVELLNAENKPVFQTKIELNNGRGSGSIYLPVALESGKYTLRSYTNWMKNFSPDFYFHKVLAIYNTLIGEDLPAKVAIDQSAIRFFPEGGNMVSGLTSKIAFKAVDSEGKGIDFRGAIVDGSNDTIVRFRPSRFGLGSFFFKPDMSRTYKVIINPVNGREFTAVLPEVFNKGVVMTVKRNATILNVNVETNIQTNEKFTLFIHSGHKPVFVQTIQGGKNPGGFTVPVDKLGDGVSHLTLFNAANQPVCERLFFKKPKKLLSVNVSSDKAQYSTREHALISVDQTSDGRPVSGDFSIAVYRADSLSKNDGDIGSTLWLTSELKGNIENPTWYFNNDADDATDDLMLTHGWRRFKWEDVLSGKKQTFEYLPELQGPIVTGRIVNADQKPVANQIAFLSVPDRRLQLYTASSNINGVINFYTKNFYGPAEINAQTDLRTDSLLRVEINSPFSTYFADSIKDRFKMYPDKSELLKRSVAMQVNNIYQSANLNKESLAVIDTAAFYIKPDKVYKLDDYVRFTTMEEVLREYVPDVVVALRNKSYQLRVFSPAITSFHNSAPLILIDGVPVFDEGNAIIHTNPRNIQRLEIVNDAYVYGRNVFQGILSFHTYKGDLADFKLPRQAAVLDYDGFQNTREFYSPMYPGDITNQLRIPDYRTTLFWSADNQIKEDGKAKLEFFTSDLAGKYHIVVQSLSENGEAGSKVMDFDVVGKVISQAGR